MPTKDKAKTLQMFAAATEAEDKKLANVKVAPEDLRTVTDLAEEMLFLKDDIADLEAKAKQLKDRYNQIRTHDLPDLMKKLGMVNATGKGSFTFGGGKVHLQAKLSASCAQANQQKFYAWLKANKSEDLIKQVVHPQTLTAFVRERREQGLEDPPGIAVWEETRAVLSR